jgi:hypothetical protein
MEENDKVERHGADNCDAGGVWYNGRAEWMCVLRLPAALHAVQAGLPASATKLLPAATDLREQRAFVRFVSFISGARTGGRDTFNQVLELLAAFGADREAVNAIK